MQSLVIVESPAKCKTIKKYLGRGYEVLASFGHVRDLPSKDGSVDPSNDFSMKYQVSRDSTKHIKQIVDAVKKSDRLILATDPDREGESISWHVLEVLKQKKALKKNTEIQRVSFNSITKSAVTEAISKPRNIDMDLVNAQQARRALDYLVGFNISPVLWRKLPGSKSAGRVQSVALRLVCEREHEIEIFNKEEYWDIKNEFQNQKDQNFLANLTHLDGEKLEKFSLKTKADTESAIELINKEKYSIATIDKKQTKRNPYAPFTTSTLQQDASIKLGFNTKRTMQTAQKLYEGIDLGSETVGLITYMRTDAVDVAPEAITQTRDFIQNKFGNEYLPNKARVYKSKAKNSQEAHEAIRPTDITKTPDSVKSYLNDDQFKLYDLIWKRMVASQAEAVIYNKVTANIISSDQKIKFRANGSTIHFDGFYKIYSDTNDEKDNLLPELNEGENLNFKISDKNPLPEQHFTQPPPRYSEAGLVKKMEELGIGRPSTYATILSVLQDRGYVKLEKKRFTPEVRGRVVTSFLEHFFTRYVEYDFTANLEDELDEISAGKLNWKDSLQKFWDSFSANVEGAMELDYEKVVSSLDKALEHLLFPQKEGEEKTIDELRTCPSCNKGRLSLKTGKYGAFVACSNYPECKYTNQFGETVEEKSSKNLTEPNNLGTDPETGFNVYLIKGPYGWYFQLGENEKGKKPKRQSLPKDIKVEEANLEIALKCLQLPRVVGKYPENNEDIIANVGKYGPYIQYINKDGKKKFISLKGEDKPTDIGINRAVEIIETTKK